MTDQGQGNEADREGGAEIANEPAADEPGTARPRRFLRSRDDRVIAGVAGGLGAYFDVDPVILRIAFAVSVLFGGLGLVAYLALALFVPGDDGSVNPQAPVQRSRAMAIVAGVLILLVLFPPFGGGLFFGDGPGALFWIALGVAAVIAAWAAVRDRGGWRGSGNLGRRSLGLIGSIALGLLGATVFLILAVGAALLTSVGEGVAIALGLAAGGVLLVGLAIGGGGRWLILPVAAVGLGVSGAVASDLDLGGGIGERGHTPATAAAIPTAGYELGIGELVVDLRELAWNGEVVDLPVNLGIGSLQILVPERVCVVGEATLRAGELRVVDQRSDEINAKVTLPESDGRPQLRLDASLDFGELRVINDDDFQLNGGERLGGDFEKLAAERNAEACAS